MAYKHMDHRSQTFWGAQCPTALGFGTQLGFDHLLPIQWLGHWGMLWSQLMSKIMGVYWQKPEWMQT